MPIRRMLIMCLLLSAATGLFAVEKHALIPGEDYRPGYVVVGLHSVKNHHEKASLLCRTYGMQLHKLNRELGYAVCTVRPGDEFPMCRVLKDNPAVAYTEPLYLCHAAYSSNDPGSSLQWHFDSINLQPVHDAGFYGQGVTVAVLDDGILPPEEWLDLPQGRILFGYDFIDNDDAPWCDCQSGLAVCHGTHVSGTIVQSTNNGNGVAGVAPQAQLLIIRVLDANQAGDIDQIATAIRYAAACGADIINMSISGNFYSETLASACYYAYNRGAFLVAAAGNSSRLEPGCPANVDVVMAVGATDFRNNKPPYSNRGVDVAAPGGNMRRDANRDGNPDGILQFTCTQGEPGYYWIQGTSMAAPHVTGLAAILLSIDDTLSQSDLWWMLTASCQDIGLPGFDASFGHGLIDADAAVAMSMAN